MRHIARKRFGQNFLVDPIIINQIVDEINPKVDDAIIEIGPGLGALSIPLIQRCKHLTAIEIDRDIIPKLINKVQTLGKLVLIEKDVLKFQFQEHFPELKKFRCVGNLPYNISTPLIFNLLKQRDWIQDMHFMLQKEVVKRMVAQSNSKTYGRLSVMVQYYCEVRHCFDVAATCFDPPPKVESAIVFLQPRRHIELPADDEMHFAFVVREAFNQRRKTIANSFKKILSKEILVDLNIDPSYRAEQLTVQDFVRIANASRS